jgi:hypothetical protein
MTESKRVGVNGRRWMFAVAVADWVFRSHDGAEDATRDAPSGRFEVVAAGCTPE